MKRKQILKAHVVATAASMITISVFFSASLWAEIYGSTEQIQSIKAGILYFLPVMLIAMPVLGITGNKLAGNSQNPMVLEKKSRMKWIFINGLLLISLAVTLYVISRNGMLDNTFLTLQIIELILGPINFFLMALNVRSGLLLSGKIKK